MTSEVTVSLVLSQAFRVFFGGFAVFGTICVLVLSPQLAALVASNLGHGWEGVPTMRDGLLSLLALGLGAVLAPVATAALVHGVFERIRGRAVTIRACIAIGFRNLFSVLVVSIVVGVLVFVGFAACVVPGLFLLTVFAVAVPVTVVEGYGLEDSLSRSWELTRGHRWTALGIVISLLVPQIVINLLLGLFAQDLGAAILLVGVPAAVIFPGLYATTSALLYYHLRRVKESIDVEDIAAVFA
jgi:hypothetical protein